MLFVLLFSHSVVSNSLPLCGLQHARCPCPSLSPGVGSNSCPLSQGCYLTISSSATLFSFCFQSFPGSGSFPMSWLFVSGGQSIRASASVLSMNKVKVKVAQSCPTLCNPYGLYSPWNSPGQNTGIGRLSFLQEIFPTPGSNPGLPQCRWILYQLSHKGSPRILEWIAYPFSRGSPCPGIEPESPASQVYSLPTEESGKNISNKYNFLYRTCFTSFVAISDLAPALCVFREITYLL